MEILKFTIKTIIITILATAAILFVATQTQIQLLDAQTGHLIQYIDIIVR